MKRDTKRMLETLADSATSSISRHFTHKIVYTKCGNEKYFVEVSFVILHLYLLVSLRVCSERKVSATAH